GLVQPVLRGRARQAHQHRPGGDLGAVLDQHLGHGAVRRGGHGRDRPGADGPGRLDDLGDGGALDLGRAHQGVGVTAAAGHDDRGDDQGQQASHPL
ncbi:MAG: hypothetical protein AVDCRST_MAG16-1720, partial [uncultured Frankineae bacterium]